MRFSLSRRRPEPQTVRSRITRVRNHLLYAELELQSLRGRDEFFQKRYDQIKELRLEFDSFPIWYGLEDPA